MAFRLGQRLLVGGATVLMGAGAAAAALHLRAPEAPAAPPPHPVAAVAKPVPVAPKPVSAPKPAPAAPANEPYVVRSILPIDGPMRHGDHYWDESRAPRTGEIVITVDLDAQVLSVFRDGHEIGTSVILYGVGSKPTPLGVFNVTEKDADHVSNIYVGAPMPYMLRLTNDGISIHGSEVVDGSATHGCVGVPRAFAKKLFGVTKLGTRVIVTNGERLDIGQPIKAA